MENVSLYNQGRSWVYPKLILTMAFWGGTFIAARIAVQTMEPFAAAFCRFAIASLCLVALTLRLEGKFPRLTSRQLPFLILLGLSGIFAYNAFFFLGLQTVPASRAALIVATNPVFIAIFSALLLKEPLTRLKGMGIALSLTGVTVVISGGNPLALLAGDMGRGELYILGCVLSWVVYTLVGKRVMGELSPLITTTYSCLFGTLALLIVALFRGFATDWTTFAPEAWMSVAYLGILGTATGFNWYYEGVLAIGSAKASVFINLVPVFAIALAALLLGESITLPLVIGGALVISGVYLTNCSR
ncbi:MAG: DMT family transporter [Synechococcales cyanobacterium T60_A2020_003]|nr:DMT family transporter [Synechococcales cyanobacterium T60_A2020_003]